MIFGGEGKSKFYLEKYTFPTNLTNALLVKITFPRKYSRFYSSVSYRDKRENQTQMHEKVKFNELRNLIPTLGFSGDLYLL